jgi:hypothetical protein
VGRFHIFTPKTSPMTTPGRPFKSEDLNDGGALQQTLGHACSTSPFSAIQRTTESFLAELSTPLGTQPTCSTDSRCRRTSCRSLKSALTPRDSTATCCGDLSRLERLNSSPLPVTVKPRIGSTANRAPMGFLSPTTSRNEGSDQHWVYLAQLCYAFRLSQPLDVLFRLRPPGLVSCQIRPWG